MPGLLIGATYGRFLGMLLQMTTPFAGINLSLYAILGAGSMMSGMLRIKAPLAVMLIEATNDVSFCVPLIIVIFTANAVGNAISHDVYYSQLVDMHVPMLDEIVSHDRFCLARHIMTRDVKCVAEVESVKRLHKLVSESTHHGFPVFRSTPVHMKTTAEAFGDNRKYLGLLSRAALVKALSQPMKFNPVREWRATARTRQYN